MPAKPPSVLASGALLLGLCACAAPPAPLVEPVPWRARAEHAEDRFGFRACFAGDLNGDGYSDLVVGAPGYDHARGRAYVYLGGPGGLADAPAWRYDGDRPGDALGDRVGSAGDVNGDGYGDLYVAAPTWHGGLGRLLLFHGSAAGPARRPSWRAEGKRPGGLFGDCTVPTGDLDGDGYDDLLVGAYGQDDERGAAYLFLGGRGGLADAPAWSARGEARGDQFGYGVGPVGDVDGDGRDDLVLGSKYSNAAGAQAGKAYLYLGAAAGGLRPAWTAFGSPGANLGTRIYGLGAPGGEGRPWVMIGSPRAGAGRGRAQAWAGGPGGLASAPLLTLAAPAGVAGYGYCLGPLPGGAARDAPQFFVSGLEDGQGRVDLYATGPSGRPRLRQTLRDGRRDSRFGLWCAPAGDVNGDGFPDLCVSADSDGGGRVDVYLGLPQDGPLLPDAGEAYFVGAARRRFHGPSAAARP